MPIYEGGVLIYFNKKLSDCFIENTERIQIGRTKKKHLKIYIYIHTTIYMHTYTYLYTKIYLKHLLKL